MTGRLLYRDSHRDDFEQWLEFFKDVRAHAHWISKKEDPITECENWYRRQQERRLNNEGGLMAMIEMFSGRLVGHSGLILQTVDGIREWEIAYSLLPEFWGKGYATEAAQKMRDDAFQNKLAPSLISIISISNIASQKVAIKNGMQLEKRSVYKENDVFIFRVRNTAVGR